MGGKRWTADERAAWIAWFRGERKTMPEGREPHQARRQLEIPDISHIDAKTMHAMATAASRYLTQVPYKGAGTHVAFIEQVEIVAVHPEAPYGQGWPPEVFREAVSEVRAIFQQMTAPVVERALEAA